MGLAEMTTEAEHDEFVNDLLANSPEQWDGDEAAESIAVAYIRHLESEVIRTGGALHPTLGPARPRIVCLCGSTRFFDEFRKANLRLTLAGEIVLSIGCDTKSDGDLAAAGELAGDQAEVKTRLDDLHKRKIDLADYVLVLNVGGYIGESTRSEIAYAQAFGTPVSYLEQP